MAHGVQKRRGSLAEINVTPLVDVMLVLLIIFMVTAPMMTRGIDIDLPKVQSGADATENRITLAIDAERKVFLNQSPIHLHLLEERLLPLLSNGDAFVFLRADSAVPYGYVMEVVDRVKRAGVVKVGLVTLPAAQPEE
jgi:biopolymer transport protein TolR